MSRGSDVDVATLLQLISRVPDELRQFTVGRAELVGRRTFPPDLVDRLVAAGLPWRDDDGQPAFDDVDLANVGLHLGLGTSHTAAMRCRSMALVSTSRGPGTYDVKITAKCPEPGHPGECRFEVRTPDGWRRGTSPPTLWQGTIHPDTEVPPFPDRVASLLSWVTDHLRFLYLPAAVRGDAEFARQTGLADCRGATAVLMAEGCRRGITCRSAFGLMLSPPFSTVHEWVEFLVADRWVPADPILLDALNRWGLVDPHRWPPQRSPAPILTRLGEEYGPLARHNGSAVPVSIPTRWDLTGDNPPKDPVTR